MRLSRRGHTLIELVVALGIGAVVIALGALVGFRHQRFHRDVVIAVERSERLGQVAALMPVSLRAIAPGEGDIAAGGARDTSLEYRATILSAVTCDSAGSSLLLAPADAVPRLASVLARPEPGDTAWLLDASSSTELWVARPIASVGDSVAACRVGTTYPWGTAGRSSLVLRLTQAPPAGARVARVTRPWRYSLYKASDGAWYLGAKEWNPSSARFNTIQPVAGPLMSAAAGGLRFRYLDSAGGALPSTPTDPARIAAIEVTLRVDSAIPGRYAHAASVRGGAAVVVALRNRVR